jgi:hypothetical protein
MAYYTDTFFDSTSGYLDSVVLGVIAQQLLINEFKANYNSGGLADAYIGAVDWSAKVSTDSSNSALSIDITFPAVAPTPLKNFTDFAERVSSLNPLSTENISIARLDSYALKCYPIPSVKPTYLSTNSDGTDNINNTLERRLIWMCWKLKALTNWVEEWNNCYTVINSVMESYLVYRTTVDGDYVYAHRRYNNDVNDVTQVYPNLVNWGIRSRTVFKMIVDNFIKQKVGLNIFTSTNTDSYDTQISSYVQGLIDRIADGSPKFIDISGIAGSSITLYDDPGASSPNSISGAQSEGEFFDPSSGGGGGSGGDSMGGGDTDSGSNQGNLEGIIAEPQNTLSDC